MRTNGQFILRKVADEYLLIPVGETAMAVKGLIALTESGALLFEKMKTECTRAELLAVLKTEYEIDEQTASADLDAFLEKMRHLQILREE